MCSYIYIYIYILTGASAPAGGMVVEPPYTSVYLVKTKKMFLAGAPRRGRGEDS